MAGIKEKMIIAMKGHPGTGKSTIAESLSSLLRIPLIDKDDIKDCTFIFSSSSIPNPNPSLLNDFSYDVVFRIASTQLRLGLSVILDTPLSRKSHLDRLVDLASSASARLLIVECRPSDESEWRRRLEDRGADAAGRSNCWHKPSTWREMEMLLQSYCGCTDYDVGDVPKLVVDTTAPVSFDEIVSGVVGFVVSNCGSSSSHGVSSLSSCS